MDGVRWARVDPLQSFVRLFCVAKLSGAVRSGENQLRPDFPQSLGGPFPSRKVGRSLFCRPVCGSTFACLSAQSWYKTWLIRRNFVPKLQKICIWHVIWATRGFWTSRGVTHPEMTGTWQRIASQSALPAPFQGAFDKKGLN